MTDPPPGCSRVEIVNQWSLWWGVTMMVVGSLIALLGKTEIFTGRVKAETTLPLTPAFRPVAHVLTGSSAVLTAFVVVCRRPIDRAGPRREAVETATVLPRDTPA